MGNRKPTGRPKWTEEARLKGQKIQREARAWNNQEKNAKQQFTDFIAICSIPSAFQKLTQGQKAFVSNMKKHIAAGVVESIGDLSALQISTLKEIKGLLLFQTVGMLTGEIAAFRVEHTTRAPFVAVNNGMREGESIEAKERRRVRDAEYQKKRRAAVTNSKAEGTNNENLSKELQRQQAAFDLKYGPLLGTPNPS